MDEFSKKRKIDLVIIIILLVFCIYWILNNQANSEITPINLSDSELSCKKARKWNNYHGYFTQNNEQYYTLERYNTCKDFKSKVTGQKVTGKYLESNNLLIELRINGKIDTEPSNVKLIYYGIFFAFIVFCFIRIPIHKLASKYV
jgi:hypothetical protein